MTYRIGIGFPTEPTKEDIKKLKRELARDMFEVVGGGQASEPAESAGGNETEPAGEED